MNYHSCFIVDVQISNELITLSDSINHHYYIDIHNKDSMQSFEKWFKTVFIVGKAQTVTVFKYSIKRDDNNHCSEIFIDKIIID